MMKRRLTLGDSRGGSPEGSDEDDLRSPVSDESDRELTSPSGSMKRESSARGRKKRVEEFVREEFRRDPLDLVH
jgi:hypothetical protein